MSEKTFLCRCTFCLNENVNGVLLNKNTYNHHCSRIQEYSVKDENLKDIRLQMEGSMPLNTLDTEEDMLLDTEKDMAEEDIQLQTEDNIYQKNDNLDLVDNNSDTESFNFNEN